MMKADANRKHCFFVKFKKHFSLTREVNLKIKEFNCENAGLRAIHTEFDADIFISWRRIINARQNIRRHHWNFLSLHCLEVKSIFLFQAISPIQ